ncbi:MAG: polysaccharide biosynthesis/export family protein, partial [Desulfobulbaceae bacterium]|nr:polysaccharide biosynthesis/export family protein [Desulfobulbaceae bacterium]
LTPTRLKEKLTKLFSDDFKDPLITITMVKYNRAIDHLKTAITTAPRGQSKLTTIRPDGYISFPIIEDIKAAGITLPRLRKIASDEYGKLIDNLTVSLILKVMKANLVYVMGEVENPNFYLMGGPTTVTQILATAGGIKNTANRSTILVVSRDKDRRPWGRLVNFEKIIREGNISRDITLNQYDIVYVPKSAITRADLWVEQYINQIIPEFITGNYNLGGTFADHAPVITHHR